MPGLTFSSHLCHNVVEVIIMYKWYTSFVDRLPRWLATLIVILTLFAIISPMYLISSLVNSSRYDEGYSKGIEDGYDSAYSDGYGIGLDEGYNDGYDDGYDNAYEEAYDEGYKEGHDVGYNEGNSYGDNLGFRRGKSQGYNEGYRDGFIDRPLYDAGDSWTRLVASANGITPDSLDGVLSQSGQLRRKEDETASSTSYIGNSNTHIFHRTGCSYLPDPENRVNLSSRSAAVSAGYEPCGKCYP